MVSSSTLNIIGALIAIFGSVGSNLGTNIQKTAHKRNEESNSQKHYTSLPLWWCGMVLTILGAFSDFGALSIASPSLVTGLGGGSIMPCLECIRDHPLLGTTLVANVVIANCWNKEKVLETDLVRSPICKRIVCA